MKQMSRPTLKESNHICRVCGTAYYACNACDRQQNWRAFCDTPEHYQVYQALVMYTRGILPADEARAMLEDIGVTPDLDGLTPAKQAEIAELFGQCAKPKRKRTKS